MNLKITKKFYKDLWKIKNIKVIEQIEKIIIDFDSLDFVDLVWNYKIKKIVWYKKFYRLRMWDYRLWFSLDNNEIIFMRILHRKEIYKYFP